MLTFTDESILLSVEKYGERDAIVALFSLNHGLVRGVVKRGLSSKTRADVQPGNLVEATWKARLPEHMGSITLEARHSFAARVMHDPLKLAAVGSVMALLSQALAERDPHPALYAETLRFLQHVAAGTEALIWLGEYVRLELALLELVGFGLDLSACAATGSREDLAYVSPKSGRAVGRAAGAPYHDRMLKLPDFIREIDHPPGQVSEVEQGLAITGHFLETRLFATLHRRAPSLRGHFLGVLARMAR